MNATLTDCLLIVAVFIAAILFPLPLIATLPLLLGIPHVLGDVRHLVIRRGILQRPSLWIFAGLPILAASLGAGPLAAAPAALGSALVARTTLLKRSCAIGLSIIFGFGVWKLGRLAPVIFVQVHNLVAIILWCVFVRHETRSKFAPLILILILFAVLFSPFMLPVVTQALSANAFQGRTLSDLMAGFAPGLDLFIGARLAIFFCFAQMIHYLVWLKFLPDSDDGAPKTDFKKPILALIALASIAFAIWGLPQAWLARDAYLKFAAFHGYLEYAALSLFLLEGGPQSR
jgi:hypothetical protein